jgi:hypothetical protein
LLTASAPKCPADRRDDYVGAYSRLVFRSSAVEVVILKMLHMFEIPFLLVGTFKYISSAFNPKLGHAVPDRL